MPAKKTNPQTSGRGSGRTTESARARAKAKWDHGFTSRGKIVGGRTTAGKRDEFIYSWSGKNQKLTITNKSSGKSMSFQPVTNRASQATVRGSRSTIASRRMGTNKKK